jgi:hypothetical protein
MMELSEKVVQKIVMARRMAEMAKPQLDSANDLALGIGVHLLQDAIEVFLLAIAEHVNARISERTAFAGYFDEIDAAIKAQGKSYTLPLRLRLMQLNRLRVSSKHAGIIPARSETAGLYFAVQEFFGDVCLEVLGRELSTISLIDHVVEEQDRQMLKEASEAFRRGDFIECLIACRKVIYLTIEVRFSVKDFYWPAPNAVMQGILTMGNRCPEIARTEDFLGAQIRDAGDLVVFDPVGIEVELMKKGIDSMLFWNVLRLTPAVHHHGADQWVVRQEFDKLTGDDLRERAEYALDATTTMFVAASQRAAQHRSVWPWRHVITLKSSGVTVYEKASQKSQIVTRTPANMRELDADYLIAGLQDDKHYYHVNCIVTDAGGETSLSFTGFICETEVESLRERVGEQPTSSKVILTLTNREPFPISDD